MLKNGHLLNNGKIFDLLQEDKVNIPKNITRNPREITPVEAQYRPEYRHLCADPPANL